MADTFSEKVLTWARGKLGQQVGRGECRDFVDQALRSAGARSSTTVGSNDDYVWGKPVRINEVAPGDVLQFRNWIVTTKTEVVVHFADGTGYRDTDEVVARRPQHTAIVKRVGGGGISQVSEQHVKPLGNRVQLHDVPNRGSPAIAKVTHKLMKDESGKMKMATVKHHHDHRRERFGLGVSPAGEVALVDVPPTRGGSRSCCPSGPIVVTLGPSLRNH